jgi:hypothetical protein
VDPRAGLDDLEKRKFSTLHIQWPVVRNYNQEAEWTPFQTHYFSENVVAPGNEPGTSRYVGRNSNH